MVGNEALLEKIPSIYYKELLKNETASGFVKLILVSKAHTKRSSYILVIFVDGTTDHLVQIELCNIYFRFVGTVKFFDVRPSTTCHWS